LRKIRNKNKNIEDDDVEFFAPAANSMTLSEKLENNLFKTKSFKNITLIQEKKDFCFKKIEKRQVKKIKKI
jgi:hypothetical protein